MIKVLHINSNYLTSKLHENLLDHMNSKSLSHTVFMPIKQEKKEEFLYKSKHTVYSPMTFKNIDKYFFVFKQKKILSKLKSIININEYNVIHAHTLFTDGNTAYELNKEYGVPYIVTVRGYTDIHNFLKKRINLRSKGRKILKNAEAVIFLSQANRTELLDNYIKNPLLKEEVMEKSQVIPNGIDEFWFEHEGNIKQLKNQNHIKCLYVGKLMKDKNVHGLIKALEKYNEIHSASLTIVGEDYEKKYAEELKESAPEFVQFVDKVQRENLIEIYRSHDLFLMPSFHETFGLVYPEAMSQGLPVVYTKNQGFDGHFPNGTVGYAVTATNPEEISEKISSVVENYQRLSQNALKEYTSFDWKLLSAQFEHIYRTVNKRTSNI